MSDPHPTTKDLLDFIKASPSPYHCVAEVAERLRKAKFNPLFEGNAWKLEPGDARYVIRGGAIIAFRVGTEAVAKAGFRIVGAHTDSPTLRVKPLAEVTKEGYEQLGVEVYGGPLTYTWLDRDLTLAGRVALRKSSDPAAIEMRRLHVARPILRIPSVAIHLNRDIRTDGLKLNDQNHLVPILGLGEAKDADGKDEPKADFLRELIAAELDVEPARILNWDLGLADVTPPTIGGFRKEFIFAPRLDNQAMCHAGLIASIRSRAGDPPAPTAVLCLYDHEEVGSTTTAGAGGPFVEDVLRRLAEVEGPGAEPGGLMRGVAHSFQISADMAHAVHPNYVDKHEPQHLPKMNGGPVIKANAQQRYATDAESAARFEALCQQADVPCQKFVNRTDLPCGSSIGPIAASRLGIRTVDVGNAMLSMHSVREQAGSQDPERMTAVMSKFFST